MDAAMVGILVTGTLGLAGIVATFFAPTWSQTKLERRREAREFRRARRLVDAELEHAATVLQMLLQALDEKRASGVFGEDLPRTAWEEHRVTLAADLSDEAWAAVEVAYSVLWAANLGGLTVEDAADEKEAEDVRRIASGALTGVNNGRDALRNASPIGD